MSNKEIKRIKTGSQQNKKQGAFLCMYAELSGKHYALMVNRGRGDIGFPGGKMEDGESESQAFQRECIEEINFDPSTITGAFKNLCSHEFPMGKDEMFTAHLWTIKVEFQTLVKAMSGITQADGFPFETSGAFLAKIHEGEKPEHGFKTLLKNKMASSVKEELLILAKELEPELVKDVNFLSKGLFDPENKKEGLIQFTPGEVVNVESMEQFKMLTDNYTCVIDFWAPWCGPCRMIAPVVEELAKEHKDIMFLKVNTDANQDIAIEEGIRSIPTINYVFNSKVVNKQVGASKKEIVENIEKYLK